MSNPDTSPQEQPSKAEFSWAEELGRNVEEIVPLDNVVAFDINPGVTAETAKRYFDTIVTEDTKALIINAYVTGALPDYMVPHIEELHDAGKSAFILAGHYGDDEGIAKAKYGTQHRAINAGAVLISGINVTRLPELSQAIQAAINRGLSGKDLDEEIIRQFGSAA